MGLHGHLVIVRTRKEQLIYTEKRKKDRQAIAARVHASKQRAKRLRRHAPWANESAIKELYELAAWLSKETGVTHEVDHIIPLLGKNVSGLHVEGNLRVITKSENRKKSNHYEIEVVGGAGFEPATPTV